MDAQTIGVAGLGLLGRGIAACCVAHNFRVIAFTRREETHSTARKYIETAIDDLIERAGFPESLRETRASRYEAVTSLSAFAPSDLVIETVTEDPQIKRQVFNEIEAVVRPEVPIASNTSAIPITDLQRDRRHPARFVGMHWGEPAHATRFCELIRGEQTSDRAFAAVAELAKRFGKDPCLVQKDVPAFIVNRIGYAMFREAVHLLEMGVADAETIDRSCRNAFGLWASMCGPFRWIDITGGPAAYAEAVANVLPTLDNSTTLSPTFRRMIDDEYYGTVNGKGFYDYSQQDKEYWERLFLEHAWTIRGILDKHFPLDQADGGAE